MKTFKEGRTIIKQFEQQYLIVVFKEKHKSHVSSQLS